MRIRRTDHFTRVYEAAPERVRRDVDKQIRLLLEQGHRYPSLRIYPWPDRQTAAHLGVTTRRSRFGPHVKDLPPLAKSDLNQIEKIAPK